MALLAPLMLALLFGIVDMGYYVWGYVTIFNSARSASEKASMMPPFPETLTFFAASEENRLRWGDDPCTSAVIEQAIFDASGRFNVQPQNVIIRYLPDPDGQPRRIGRPIEVVVSYDIQPLTPLVQFAQTQMGNNGVMSVRAVSQRTIEALGQNPNPQYAARGGVACALPQDFEPNP
jgi:membrane-associated protease RseP (regulator of RpoE activity)